MVSDRITFGGIASGLDTNMIIDHMLQMQQRPIRMAEERKSEVQSRMDALGTIGSRLSNLLRSTTALQDADTFRARNASVRGAGSDALSVTADSSAVTGSFAVEVLQLATSTKAGSTGPVGQAVDPTVSLDEAGFRTAFEPGTFSINGTKFTVPGTTATSLASAGSVGVGFNPGVALQGADLDIPVEPGTGAFEINGVTINWSAEEDSLDDVIARINQSGAGVTASYDDELGGLKLVSNATGESTLALEDIEGNFLEAMKLVDGDGEVIGTETPGEDLMSLNDVIAMINDAEIGVTASLVDDEHGRPNLLELTSGADIQLGSGGDTSNFLSVTSLLQTPSGTTRTSALGLAGVNTSTDLQDARMETALTESSGSFEINGVSISYNAEVESLQNVISRINASGAGVTASYNAQEDRVVLTQNETGSTTIELEDAEGNFLAAFGILDAEQDVGLNAAYRVDGGTTRYSTSNTITDAVSGISMVAQGTTDEPLTVEVSQSTRNVVSAVEGFVKEFNEVLGTLREMTKYNEDGPNGILFGDGSVRRMEQTMRSILTRPVEGLPEGIRTLSDIGISFGAIGSAVGTTNDLELDAQKLTRALETEPDAVSQLLSSFSAGATLEEGGTGSIESIIGSPANARKAGRYEIASNGAGQLTATFIPNDGSGSTTATGTITPGGTNTTLIPGVEIMAKDTLVEGAHVITVHAEQEGIAKSLHEFVDSLTRSGGLLSNRTEEMQGRIRDIDGQIERAEERLARREEQLVRQFAAMEQAFARMETQQQALMQMQAQLQNL